MQVSLRNNDNKFMIIITQALHAGLEFKDPMVVDFTAEKISPYDFMDEPEKMYPIKVYNFFDDNNLKDYVDNVKTITVHINKFNKLDVSGYRFVYLPQIDSLTDEKIDTTKYAMIVGIN